MRRISSVTTFSSGDGTVVSYTYSEIDNNGIPVKQNVRKQFIVPDGREDLENAFKTLKQAAMENVTVTEGE